MGPGAQTPILPLSGHVWGLYIGYMGHIWGLGLGAQTPILPILYEDLGSRPGPGTPISPMIVRGSGVWGPGPGTLLDGSH